MARYALVIGIAKYKDRRLSALPKALTDAEQVAQLLERYGEFQFVERFPRRWHPDRQTDEMADTQVTAAALDQVLTTFLLERATQGEAVIYFTGHGFVVQEFQNLRGFLATSDCEVVQQGDQVVAQVGAYPFESLNVLLQRANLSSLVLLLDCCHSGYFLEKQGVRQSLAVFGQRTDYCLLTACRGFEQAWVGSQHSVFTEALLAGLAADRADALGWVDSDTLSGHLYYQLERSGQEPLRLYMGRPLRLLHYPPPVVKSGERPVPPVALFNPENPYVGLKAFDQKTKAYFYGRQAASWQLFDRLRSSRFVAVIGASGCGKSSLVKAGVLAELRDDRLANSSHWVTAMLTPGDRPLPLLLETLDQLHCSPQSLLLVDQLEEIFTLCKDDEQRRSFIRLIAQEATDTHREGRVIVAIRGDFLDRCAEYDEIARLLNRVAPTTYAVQPLSQAELTEAITEPAILHGVRFEPGLVEQMIAEVADAAGVLPLLQHALWELWDTCITKGVNAGETPQPLLTWQGYEKIGRVAGALERRADLVYASCASEDDRDFCRRLFTELAEISGETVTRRPVPQRQLQELATSVEQCDRILSRLVEQRLLVTNTRKVGMDSAGEENYEAYVDVAHEALLTQWQRLKNWLDEDRNDIRLERRFREACADWQRQHNRSSGALLSGVMLDAVVEWSKKSRSRLSRLGQEFLQASLEQRDREQLAEIEQALELQRLAEARQQEAEKNLRLEKQRSRLIFRSWLLVAGLLAAISTSALIFTQSAQQSALIAQKGEVNTLTRLADFYFTDHQQLEALFISIQALSLLKKYSIQSYSDFNKINFIISSLQERNRLTKHESEVYGLSINSNLESLKSSHIAFASADSDGVIKLWDIRGNLIKSINKQNSGIWKIDFSASGKLLSSAGMNGKIEILEVETGNLIKTLPGHTGQTFDSRFTANDNIIISCGADGRVRVWDLGKGGSNIKSSPVEVDINGYPMDYYIYGIDIHPKKTNIIAYGGEGDKSIKIWDLESNQIVAKLENPKTLIGIIQIKFSPDGSMLIATDDGGLIKIWSMESLTSPSLIKEFSSGQESIYSIDISKDGKFLVTGSTDHTIKVWDIEKLTRNQQASNVTGQIAALSNLEGHSATVQNVKFLMDYLQKDNHTVGNPLIISASNDATIRLWDWQSFSLRSKDLSSVKQSLDHACSLFNMYVIEKPKEIEAICVGSPKAYP